MWLCVVCVCGTVGGVSVQQVALCLMCVCGTVGGSECAAGGFVLCICVCVCGGNYMTAVLRTIHLFHEGLSGYL